MSNLDDLRKRLEALNREPLEPRQADDASSAEEDLRRRLDKGRRAEESAAPDTPGTPPPIVFQRDLPRRESDRVGSPARPGAHVTLEEAVEGSLVRSPDGSTVYVVERRLAGPDGQWETLCASFAQSVTCRDSGLWAQLDHVGVVGDFTPEDLVFLDLETTGLGCSPLFLIGTMVWDGSGLVTRQYFARDYSQERGVVALFLQRVAARKLLVSFNGKSFDQPYVRTRAAANRIPCRFDLAHFDLLHAARRLWKGRLPDCRLQTLERYVCRRSRHDDLPGHLIPDAYHAYVRTGNAAQMVDVLKHNFLDLVTMADLIARMPCPNSD